MGLLKLGCSAQYGGADEDPVVEATAGSTAWLCPLLPHPGPPPYQFPHPLTGLTAGLHCWSIVHLYHPHWGAVETGAPCSTFSLDAVNVLCAMCVTPRAGDVHLPSVIRPTGSGPLSLLTAHVQIQSKEIKQYLRSLEQVPSANCPLFL